MELHVFPIPIPPPTSLSTGFLWVFPVHQARALVSCIQPGLVICFTLDNIHVSMLFSRRWGWNGTKIFMCVLVFWYALPRISLVCIEELNWWVTGLPSMGSHRVGHDWNDLAAVGMWIWRIPWTEEPGRLESMGLQSQTRLSEKHFHFHLCFYDYWDWIYFYIFIVYFFLLWNSHSLTPSFIRYLCLFET